jgi:hypothetical protein
MQRYGQFLELLGFIKNIHYLLFCPFSTYQINDESSRGD